MINFLSNNIMLPILDFFYGIVPSYGLAIVALTLVIRFALFPVSANQIRNMRRMKIANPIMQKRTKEVQERYKNDPVKQQEEMRRVQSENFKEFGNPLSGCLPALLQLPILFALFATLRGSPFANINYTVNFQVYPQAQQEEVQPQAFATKTQSVYFADRVHLPIQATVASGTNLVVGDTVNIDLRSPEGEEFTTLRNQYPETNLQTTWQITKGEGVIQLDQNGNIVALQPGDATVQVTVPGLAANKGFLFIQALGKVGVTNADGSLNWDILVMILGFGVSLYINQLFTNKSSPKAEPEKEDESGSQQELMNKFTPIIFSGMFLFFPLPSGVLLYMLIANIFQTLQSYIISREPLPENLQRIMDGGPAVAIATKAGEPTKSAAPKSEKSGSNRKGKNASKKKLSSAKVADRTEKAESKPESKVETKVAKTAEKMAEKTTPPAQVAAKVAEAVVPVETAKATDQEDQNHQNQAANQEIEQVDQAIATQAVEAAAPVEMKKVEEPEAPITDAIELPEPVEPIAATETLTSETAETAEQTPEQIDEQATAQSIEQTASETAVVEEVTEAETTADAIAEEVPESVATELVEPEKAAAQNVVKVADADQDSKAREQVESKTESSDKSEQQASKVKVADADQDSKAREQVESKTESSDKSEQQASKTDQKTSAAKPTQPVDSVEPTAPAKPAKPEKPTKPAKSTKSTKGKKDKQKPTPRQPLPFEPGFGKKKKPN
jgi:YidC/Oxa1 family membrane protein insertase